MPMQQDIKVSVVIPVYDAERYLEQCLDSVLTQSLREIEVICVDDGSRDSSLEILDRYAALDGRIRVLRQTNQFAGVARNNGMRVANGKYIAFLDADDYYIEGALERLYRLAEQHRLDFVKGSFYCADALHGVCYTSQFSQNGSVGFFWRRWALTFRRLPLRLLNAADVPWNGLYRRSFLEENGIVFNSLRCVNDRSFYIHCLLKAKRIMVAACYVACYRVGQAGSLIGRKANHFSSQLGSYEIVRGLCEDVERPLARMVLRQELNGVFGWYTQLRENAAEPEVLDAQLIAFLRSFDEADVGAEYLREFSWRDLYYRMRYETAAPGKRPPLPVRAYRCWKEHGLRYTITLFFNMKGRVLK